MTPKNIFKKWLRKSASIIFLALGLYLFYATLRAAGFENLRDIFLRLKGPELFVLVFYPCLSIWDVMGWHVLFDADARKRIGLFSLFRVRVAGEALNNVTPFLDVGGEPLKISILSKHYAINVVDAFVPTFVSRAAIFYSQVIFWMTSLVPLCFVYPVEPMWRMILLTGVMLIALFCAFTIRWQRQGLFQKASSSLGLQSSSLLAQLLPHAAKADSSIAAYYGSRRGDFYRALFYHWMSWMIGAIETYLMFMALGIPIHMTDALFFEAVLQLVRTGGFFIPANIGVQEAGMAFFGAMFGFDPSVGVAFSLVKRARRVLWTMTGFGIWAHFISARKRKTV